MSSTGVLKATQFRKHMFEILEMAIKGEPVESTYKGSRLTLSVQPTVSKLARAVRRNMRSADFADGAFRAGLFV